MSEVKHLGEIQVDGKDIDVYRTPGGLVGVVDDTALGAGQDLPMILVDRGRRINDEPVVGWVHEEHYCTDDGPCVTWYPTRAAAHAAMCLTGNVDIHTYVVDRTPPGVRIESWECIRPAGPR